MNMPFSRLEDLLSLDRETLKEALRHHGSGLSMKTAVTLLRLDPDCLYTLSEASCAVFGDLSESAQVRHSLTTAVSTNWSGSELGQGEGDEPAAGPHGRKWRGRTFQEHFLHTSAKGVARTILCPALLKEVIDLKGSYRGFISPKWINRLTNVVSPVELRDAVLALRGELEPGVKCPLAERIAHFAGPKLVEELGRAIGEPKTIAKLEKAKHNSLPRRWERVRGVFQSWWAHKPFRWSLSRPLKKPDLGLKMPLK